MAFLHVMNQRHLTHPEAEVRFLLVQVHRCVLHDQVQYRVEGLLSLTVILVVCQPPVQLVDTCQVRPDHVIDVDCPELLIAEALPGRWLAVQEDVLVEECLEGAREGGYRSLAPLVLFGGQSNQDL